MTLTAQNRNTPIFIQAEFKSSYYIFVVFFRFDRPSEGFKYYSIIDDLKSLPEKKFLKYFSYYIAVWGGRLANINVLIIKLALRVNCRSNTNNGTFINMALTNKMMNIIMGAAHRCMAV